MRYEIELAKEILNKKMTKKIYYIPIKSSDTEFMQYKDNYIEIIAGLNTQVLNVKIYNPLTSGIANPIICVDDNGEYYRSHGEINYFVMYAERLLGKDITIGSYEWNQSKQAEVDKLLQ